MTEIEAIRLRHQPVAGRAETTCAACLQPWRWRGCDTVIVLEYLDRVLKATEPPIGK